MNRTVLDMLYVVTRHCLDGMPVVSRPGERSGSHGCGGLDNAATRSGRDQLPDISPAWHGPPATFGSLGVPAPLVATLAATGITEPFPIQAATLPDALAG